jgi:hypothetical protein
LVLFKTTCIRIQGFKGSRVQVHGEEHSRLSILRSRLLRRTGADKLPPSP